MEPLLNVPEAMRERVLAPKIEVKHQRVHRSVRSDHSVRIVVLGAVADPKRHAHAAVVPRDRGEYSRSPSEHDLQKACSSHE